MQKKLIALAVAGLASSAAFAQSNVTIYGVADVYYGVGHSGGSATRTNINSGGLSGSRLGFKGTEDLGNGLKALFTLEYGLAVDDNAGVGSTSTGTGNTRQSFVGLTGGFGTAVAGRLQTAGYDFSGVTNAFHGVAINPLQRITSAFAGSAVTAIATDGSLIGQSSRASNAVAYISPSFGGVTLAYNHARLSETAQTITTNGTTDANANLYSATYKGGPVVASAIVTTAATNAGGHISEWAVGGGYDFGVVNLKASYQRQKMDGRADDDKAWQISGIVPVTAAGKVIVGYAKSDIGSVANQADDSKSWSVAYTHSLSKRTTLYTGVQYVKNDSAATRGTALSALPLAGGNSRGFVAGVNHSF
ncbi:porin [Denitratisoma sp. agr-D3]